MIAAVDLLRHAIDAAEVAAVGDRDAQVAQWASKGVEHVHPENGSLADDQACRNGPVALIDDVLADFDAHEVHSVTSTRSTADALATPVAADPVIRALFRLRGLSTEGTIGELFARMRFEELARDDREVVFGVSGTPWRRSSRMGAFAAAQPGTVRVAVNFRSDGSRLSTETRIAAVDDEARRAFLRYWRVVGPFSAVIRRRWLRRIAG